MSVNRPAGLVADTYQIVANIVPVQALVESNTSDNLVTSPTKTVTSAPAFMNLAGTFGTPGWSPLPTSVVAGKPLSGNVAVVVNNLGNVALPSGENRLTSRFVAV